MSVILTAQGREKGTKGAARRLREAGMVPAVIYGAKKDPQPIAVSKRDVKVALTQSGGFFTTIHTVDVDGKKQKVIARDLQRHVVNEEPLHIDFLRFDASSELNVNIRVEVIGEEDSPGIDEGGVLQMVRHELELICRADSIPEFVTIDVSKMEMGDSLHISEVQLPEGSRSAITDRDFTIASIIAPRAVVEEEEPVEGEEGEEGVEAAAEGEEGAEGAEKAEGSEEGGDESKE